MADREFTLGGLDTPHVLVPPHARVPDPGVDIAMATDTSPTQAPQMTHTEQLAPTRSRAHSLAHSLAPSHAPSRAPTEHHHTYILPRLRRRLPPPSRARLRAILAGLMTSMVLCGWTDGSVGPLVPSLQKHYGINYLLISLIYTTSFAGSMVAGLMNVWITDRIGFGLATPLGVVSSAIAYLLMGTGAHYAVFLIAFAFSGFGLALQDAQVNNLCSRLPDAGNKMMIVQACFGLGGTLAPLAATAFAQHVESKSSYYFFVAMGVALLGLVVLIVCFEGRTEEQIESWREAFDESGNDKEGEGEKRAATGAGEGKEETGEAEVEGEEQGGEEMAREQTQTQAAAQPAAERKVPQSSGAKMKRIFATPALYFLMMFSFIYIGIEVALSSWSVTFLRRERGGSAAAGYVTTGFWGGMTVSRIVLIPVTNRLGYQVSIYLYSAIALALELIIWFTHSLVGNGVCYAFVGFFLGPVYPIALMVIAEVLDDDLRGGIMGLMGSVGGAGAAAVPFMTGAIADRFGIWTLQPVAVAMIAGYVLLWSFVPMKSKSRFTLLKKRKKKVGSDEAEATGQPETGPAGHV